MLSLLMAVLLFAGAFVSCKKDDRIPQGEILVVYNDTAVYESEVVDIINYTLSTSMTKDTTAEEMEIMMGKAIGTYVQFKILELDYNDKGVKVDEKAVKAQYKLEKESIEENYEGGYKAWMEDMGVSEYFLEEEVRRYILTDMYYDEVSDGIKITEEEMKNYMNLHSADYYKPAGYSWTMIFREVKDITDEAECAVAEAEAQEYINKIQNGEMTLEEAEKELLAKYTEEEGYTKADFFGGSDFTSMQSMPAVNTQEILDALIANHSEVYAKRDPNADTSSEEYAAYMNYISECFEAETYFALQTIEAKTVYSKPIKSVIGYGIVRLDSIVETSSFAAFEDVKGELFAKVFEEKIQNMMESHLNDLHQKYNVQYLYTSLID